VPKRCRVKSFLPPRHEKIYIGLPPKKLLTYFPSACIILPSRQTTDKQFEEKDMTAYTDKMVSDMTSAGSFTYETASEFANAHSLSVRSVISKVKNLGLPYTPKPITKSSAGPRITKADIVLLIADAAGASPVALAGLDKADVRSLRALLAALPS
jgi:hypothetical protein